MTWKLGRRPELDGLRGLAVLMVVGCHVLDTTWSHPFGQAGVVVFFVLSGFLITSLLADELEDHGKIRLQAFYIRRMRRLAPALLVAVAFVALLGAFLGSWWTSPRALLGALTWTSNYVAPSSTAGVALSHTWSLAIEEQFYLAWPLILVALWRLPWVARRVILGAAVAFGAVLPFLLFSAGPWHVYYGTDTRSLPLLAGCLLALSMRRRPEGRGSRPGAGIGVALVLVPCIVWHDQLRTGWVLPQVVSLAAVVTIWCACQAAPIGWLTWGWLRYVGERSYGLYLWHQILATLAIHYGLSTPLRIAAVLPAAALATWLSWELVEVRFRAPRARQAYGQPATSVPAVVPG